MKTKYTAEDAQVGFRACLRHNGNVAAACKELGYPHRSTLIQMLKRNDLWDRMKHETTGSISNPHRLHATHKANKERIVVKPTTTGCSIDYVGEKITTEQELLADAKIDMELYEIERCVINNWEVAGTKKNANESDSLWKTGLRQIKVSLRRKKDDQVSVERILKRMEENSPVMMKTDYPKRKKGERKRALEISIMDPHYGMLCYQGDSDHSWDLETCEKLCMWSINELIAEAENHGPFEQIVFPFGNDFLHHDNLRHETTRGTPQPEGVSYLYAYERAIQLAIEMVERLAEIAPVKLIQVSGNHDQETAFTLGHVLRAWYRNDPNVDVDVSPSPYKFWRYGTNLLGFDHGHHVKPPRLAALMAHECRSDWAETTYREWHLGDQHRKGSGKPLTMEEQGVSVEYLPALTPPNAWHRLKAFNWQQRGAMGYVWDFHEGPKARVQANLDSYTGKPTGK